MFKMKFIPACDPLCILFLFLSQLCFCVLEGFNKAKFGNNMSAWVELSWAEQYGLCHKAIAIRLYKAIVSVNWWLDSLHLVLTLTNTPLRALKSHRHKLMSSGISLKCSCAFTLKTSFPYGVRYAADSTSVSGSTLPPEAVVSGLFINT